MKNADTNPTDNPHQKSFRPTAGFLRGASKGRISPRKVVTTNGTLMIYSVSHS